MIAIQRTSFEIGPLFAKVLTLEYNNFPLEILERKDFVALVHNKQQIILVQWI